MYVYQRIFFLLFFIAAFTTGFSQTARPKQTKKSTTPLIKAHRGTVLTDVHVKVAKKAQQRYSSFPRIGTEVIAVPAGAIAVNDSTASYFYKAGIYYLQHKSGYIVTLPNPGLRLKGLPIGYRIVPVGDKNYYYYFGTFYRQVENSDSYEVATPPETAVVDGLPDGYTIKKIDDTEYYFLNGTYYAEVDAPKLEGKIGYEVVVIIEAY
jgi:hypothetical protein